LRLGLIAGAGDLPVQVLRAAEQSDIPVFAVALRNIADPARLNSAKVFRIAEFGKVTRYFHKNDVSHICLAGLVKRPDFSNLKPDLKAVRFLPGAIKAAQSGDDALLRYIIKIFEDDGFEIVAPQEICKDQLLPEGLVTESRITNDHKDDVKKACEIASKIGELDIGQGAIVCRGVILGVEAQEGTDALLERIAELPVAIRGTAKKRAGILAKLVKPGQDMRVDLPTLGPKTIENADKAGLAGIVAEAGKTFILDRETVIERANEAGIFIAGIPSAK